MLLLERIRQVDSDSDDEIEWSKVMGSEQVDIVKQKIAYDLEKQSQYNIYIQNKRNESIFNFNDKKKILCMLITESRRQKHIDNKKWKYLMYSTKNMYSINEQLNIISSSGLFAKHPHDIMEITTREQLIIGKLNNREHKFLNDDEKY